MQPDEWKLLLARSAAPDRVEHYAAHLAAALGKPNLRHLEQEQLRILASLFSGSLPQSDLLLKNPEWLQVLDPEGLSRPRQITGLWREVNDWFKPAMAQGNYPLILGQLREFKQKEFLRIAARDLARLAHVSEITREIANVADVCVEVVYRVHFQQLTKRFGTPYTQELTGKWEPATFCILGMGKLGGQELNYSSDIDLLFVYNGEGALFKSPPSKSSAPGSSMTAHQFFNRLSEAIISEITKMTDQGSLFRVDLRLRPEGKSGPLSRSLASYETYYFQWGQTWERMMLIKTRCIAGDQALGAEFLDMIQPFRYPRAISEQLPREVAAMKQRIEQEVVRSGELDRNVKLGRGGIREIEFIAQTLQVLQAGRLPFLQTSKTLEALDKIAAYHLLERKETEALKEAYCFLRDVEHRLQMEDNRQTHTIPENRAAQTRLARLMGFDSLQEFNQQLRKHNQFVRSVYEKLMHEGHRSDAEDLIPDFVENPQKWHQLLAEHGFREPERGLHLLKTFVLGPGFGHISSRTSDLALQLVQTFLSWCPRKPNPPPPDRSLSDPDRVLARLDSFVTAYGARATLYESWGQNRSLFKLLLLLFDRSEFLAELAIRVPDLVEGIELSGQLRRRRNTEQILADLRQGLDDADQQLWLRRYYQTEQMRLGLRDILGLANAEQIQAELTALADAFLIYALEVIVHQHRLRKPPFAIFGLGKLGGRELIYASDLDIIFVAPDSSTHLPKAQKFAVELMELLSQRTEHGTTFATDARLRPDGEKGLLVNTQKAFHEYYSKRALLWEIQSLSRARPIAGDPRVLSAFPKLVATLSDFSAKPKNTAAWSPDWKHQIHQMRLRIQKERTPSGKDHLAIKTGTGGLMDAEFVAQALTLENGWFEPNTLSAIRLAVQEQKLNPKIAEQLSNSFTRLIEIERILRRWSYEPESVLPDDPAPLYRVAIRCGFENIDQFMQALSSYRQEMRSGYLQYFGTQD